MYKCYDCNKVSVPSKKSNVVATGYRHKEYFLMKRSIDDEGNDIVIKGDKQGEGLEMTGSKIVCDSCSKNVPDKV